MGNSLNNIVFQPPEVTYTQDKRQLTWIRTEKNRQIPAIFIDRQAKVTILFSHGNAEDLGSAYEWFVIFSSELKVNLLAYDYSGYGLAGGVPSEEACYEDISASFSYLVDSLCIPSENIVLFGRSLGTGPSLYLAEKLAKQKVPLGGIILQSPFLSIFRVAFPFRFTLPGDMFANIDRIKSVACPIWILHGTKDEVVPFWNGEELFFASPLQLRAKPFWIEGGGHNDLESYNENQQIFFEQFKEFLFEYIPPYSQSNLLSHVNALHNTKNKHKLQQTHT